MNDSLETVTILRSGAPTTDRYGNEIPGADVRIVVDDCLVAPRFGGDVTDRGRQGVVVGATVYFPKGVEVRASDRLEVRGEPHVIEGEPGWWKGAPGRWDVEVATRRVEG
jgi:hypothetical protein